MQPQTLHDRSHLRAVLENNCKKQVIDVDGVNRTPKALLAIAPSAALRHAKGLLSDADAGGGGDLSNAAEGFAQLLSSANFSRGWFDSGPAPGAEASTVGEQLTSQEAAACA